MLVTTRAISTCLSFLRQEAKQEVQNHTLCKNPWTRIFVTGGSKWRLSSAVKLILKGAIMATIGLKGAYSLPIHQSFQKYLKFAVPQRSRVLHLQFVSLLYAISSTPRVFTKIMTEVISTNYHHPISRRYSGGCRVRISTNCSPSIYYSPPLLSGVGHIVGKVRFIQHYQKSVARNPVRLGK